MTQIVAEILRNFGEKLVLLKKQTEMFGFYNFTILKFYRYQKQQFCYTSNCWVSLTEFSHEKSLYLDCTPLENTWIVHDEVSISIDK